MSDGNDGLRLRLGVERFLIFYVQNKTSMRTGTNFLNTLYVCMYLYIYRDRVFRKFVPVLIDVFF